MANTKDIKTLTANAPVTRTNRRTGFEYTVAPVTYAGFEVTDEERWVVVCEEHGDCVTAPTKGAVELEGRYMEFCSKCNDAAKARKRTRRNRRGQRNLAPALAKLGR